MLDAWGEHVPHSWVTGDDELGRHARFRHELRERGERSVLGVPCPTTMRDGEKGPVDIEMVTRRVQTRIERKRTGPEAWLVVTRRPQADDRTLEPHASRDATDQDTQHRYQYYLTPTDGSKVAFKEPSLAELA